MFIVFEGVDGSGKSTQLNLLNKYLSQRGLNTLATREPGGTPVGEKIRELLLNPNYPELVDRTEALLYAAARAQLVDQVLRPKLKQGMVVLCDRYIDSTLAYQGYGRGMDLDFLRQINKLASGGLEPNLTILLDLAPEEGLTRSRRERAADRLENQSLNFYHQVRQGYLELAQRKPETYLVVDAQQAVEQIHNIICTSMGGLLGV